MKRDGDAFIRPPEYRSPEYYALPEDHPHRYEALVHAAECWRLLTLSPHLAELLAEWVEWTERCDMSHSTAAMAALYSSQRPLSEQRQCPSWRSIARRPTYAELARLRAQPAWVAVCQVLDEDTGYPCRRVLLDAAEHKWTGREHCLRTTVARDGRLLHPSRREEGGEREGRAA